MSTYTPDLFDTAPAATPDLLDLFERWADNARDMGRGLNDESRFVYRDMWGALVNWARGQVEGGQQVKAPVQVLEITPEQLEAFLASRGGAQDLDHRYALRMLRLVERVLRYHSLTTDTPFNDAVARFLDTNREIKHANASKKTPLPDILGATDARALVAHLMADAAPSADWQDLRNRAVVALHLGAGLTPAEVRALKFAGVPPMKSGERKLRVPANGNVLAHETPVAQWAWRLLAKWLDVGQSLGIPNAEDAFVFPSTRSGREWGKTAHYEAVEKVLRSAGLADKGGAYRLRHTFAVRQLKNKRSVAEVGRWLGIDEAGALKYTRLVSGNEDVV